MSVLFAWPAQLKLNDRGMALTFVVPAADCDLRCKFCAIRQRKEVGLGGPVLSPADYAHFVCTLAQSRQIAVASIQGYEPLLEESWAYTAAILAAARRAGVPSSLVTNGTNLLRRAADLAILSPSGITVSLDSADAETHDRLRGVAGTFAKTVSGIQALTEMRHFAGRVTVSSVLMPKQPELLAEIPELLARIGVRTWVISPLLRIGGLTPGGVVGRSRQVVADVLKLAALAQAAGVELILDDELGELATAADGYNEFITRRFARPDGLIRLGPTGACSAGVDILREVDANTPVWSPQRQDPCQFVDRVLDRQLAREPMVETA